MVRHRFNIYVSNCIALALPRYTLRRNVSIKHDYDLGQVATNSLFRLGNFTVSPSLDTSCDPLNIFEKHFNGHAENYSRSTSLGLEIRRLVVISSMEIGLKKL